jgi:AraC-like DNA-binding protein
MQIIFNIQDGNHFPLQNGLPEGFRGNVLQGAMASHAHNASGLVILQNYHHPDFTIQLGIFKFFYLVRSVLHPPEFPIVSLLSLKNNMNCVIEGIEALSLKENEFCFLNFNSKNIVAEFEGSQEYHLLEISWSPKIIAQTIPHFPNLAGQFEKGSDIQSASFIIAPHSAGKKTLRPVQDILNSPFEATVNEAYFEYKIREYLLLLMVESSRKGDPKLNLTEEQKEKLMALKLRIEQDPVGRFRITDMAREMEMNEMKLKLAFKQLVGKPITEFHMDQRMKEAYRLLKFSGLSTKAVARLVGYEYTTNFITGFRRYYGFPPSDIQKKL